MVEVGTSAAGACADSVSGTEFPGACRAVDAAVSDCSTIMRLSRLPVWGWSWTVYNFGLVRDGFKILALIIQDVPGESKS